ILSITQRRAADDYPTLETLFRVGVIASVIDLTALDDGNFRLVVKGIKRVSIVQLAEGQFLTAAVAAIEESRGQEAEAFTLSRAVLEEFRKHGRPELPAYARFPNIREPGLLESDPFKLKHIRRF